MVKAKLLATISFSSFGIFLKYFYKSEFKLMDYAIPILI